MMSGGSGPVATAAAAELGKPAAEPASGHLGQDAQNALGGHDPSQGAGQDDGWNADPQDVNFDDGGDWGSDDSSDDGSWT